MRRNKFKKIMTVLMASAALATMGFSAVACSKGGGGNGGSGGDCAAGGDHDWKPNWSTTQHWEYCTKCDEETEKLVHEEGNIKDGLCDVCGATMPSESSSGVFTITLNANGGTLGSVTTVQTSNGKLATLPVAPTPPANKTFKGWYDAAKGGNPITTDTVFTEEGTTIYAQWNDSNVPTGVFTITLNANGGTLGSVSSVETSGGKLANLPVAPMPPANKKFTGWYSAAEGGTRITTSTEFDRPMTIFAQWDNISSGEETTGKNEYTIYLYAPEATGGSIVTISVWGGMAGAFSDGATMSAVSGSASWYSYKFKTDKEIADGANFNLYVDDEQVATGYTTDASWVYFASGQNDIKWNSMAAAEAAYNESQGGGEDVETETTTVYFHKPSDWEGSYIGVHAYYGAADKVVTGGWGDTHMTVDSGDWYKVEIELPEDTANFNIIVFDENDTNDAQIRKSLNVTTGIGSNVYINAKGKAFTTKEAAEADEDDTIPKAHSYTFYMYAPEASSVTIGVWGNFAGEIGDGTVMTAVDGHDGWYSYTLNTDIELKAGNGINLNIFVDGENKGKYSEDDTALYFIPVGGDRGFTSFEAAKDKYDELTAPVDPSDQENVTISITVDTDTVGSTVVYIYVYGDEEMFGGWPGEQMALVSGSTYSITLTAKKKLSGSYNIIINNNNGSQYDLATITVTDGTWSCPNSAVTITKA